MKIRRRGFEKVSENRWNKEVEGLPTRSENGDPIIISPYNDIKLPTRATALSAGYDLFSVANFNLYPGEEIKIPFGWKVYMQKSECLLIIPRSGLGFKFYTRLANTVGLIDADYYNNSGNEGLCWIKIRNEGEQILSVNRGDAIAQGVFINYLLSDDDDSSAERVGGIGSTTDKENIPTN